MIKRHRPPDREFPQLRPVPGSIYATIPRMIGRQVGPYRILREIGSGASGSVYLAEDTVLHRHVALKSLAGGDARLRDRVYREARTAARLSHPGIVTLHGVHEVDQQLFLIYEFVEGKTLREEIDGAFHAASFLQTALEIAQALKAAHEMNVVHGDLKPENIMRGADGRIRILDFGMAAVQASGIHGGQDRTQPEGGTVAYMSPEQIEHLAVDSRSDLFSLGIVLYELASGVHPFEGATPASTSVRILTSAPVPLSESRPDVPRQVSRIIDRCLQKSPEARYASAAELADDLRRAGIEAGPAAVDAPEQGRPGGRFTPGWWWRFHQFFMTALYCAALAPPWIFRRNSRWGLLLFFAMLLCAAAAAMMRGHLWFASRFYDSLLERQMQRSRLWVRWLDWAFGMLVFLAAAMLAEAHPEWASFLVVLGVVDLAASLMIEPATTLAAFGQHRGRQ